MKWFKNIFKSVKKLPTADLKDLTEVSSSLDVFTGFVEPWTRSELLRGSWGWGWGLTVHSRCSVRGLSSPCRTVSRVLSSVLGTKLSWFLVPLGLHQDCSWSLTLFVVFMRRGSGGKYLRFSWLLFADNVVLVSDLQYALRRDVSQVLLV